MSSAQPAQEAVGAGVYLVGRSKGGQHERPLERRVHGARGRSARTRGPMWARSSRSCVCGSSRTDNWRRGTGRMGLRGRGFRAKAIMRPPGRQGRGRGRGRRLHWLATSRETDCTGAASARLRQVYGLRWP